MTTSPHDAWNILFEKKLFVRAETKRKLIPGNSVYQGGVEGCVCVLQAHVKCGQIGLILKRLDDKNYYKSWPIFWFFSLFWKNSLWVLLGYFFAKLGLFLLQHLVTLLMYERLSSTFPNFNLKCYPWQRGSLLGFTVDKIVINMLWDNLDFPQINMSIR